MPDVLAWSINIVARARNRIEAIMTEHFFDHDRLDVYRLSIEYVATAFDTSRSLTAYPE